LQLGDDEFFGLALASVPDVREVTVVDPIRGSCTA
jgi:hypothetical protein